MYEPTPTMGLILVVMLKQNGNLRICLDLKDLNCAVLNEHYPLSTIQDIATPSWGQSYHNLRSFSGFWHISLDEKLFKIMAFNHLLVGIGEETIIWNQLCPKNVSIQNV